MDILKIINICKNYETLAGKQEVLKNLSFNVPKGDWVAIMGPSGSGKSTLMNIIGLLDKPTSGEYKLVDKEVSFLTKEESAEFRSSYIGFIFQSFNLLPRLSVIENVILPSLYNPNRDESKLNSHAEDLLKMVGLLEYKDRFPVQLSGGQQQRVAIARSLMNNPALILADEPTGNLDPTTSLEIMNIFRELNKQGKTIVVITHEYDIAHQAKRILKLFDGKFVEEIHNV